MTPSPPRGLLLLLSTLCAAACPACLILDPVDFPPRENHAPERIETIPDIEEFRLVARDQVDNLRFSVTIRDVDLEDQFEARAFVDPEPQDSPNYGAEVEVLETDPSLRVVSTSIPPRNLPRGCHVVVLDVIDDTNGWAGGATREVKPGVKKVTTVWWVIAHDGDDAAEIPPITCRTSDVGADGEGAAP